MKGDLEGILKRIWRYAPSPPRHIRMSTTRAVHRWRRCDAGGGDRDAGGALDGRGAIGSPGPEPSEKGEHLSGSDLPSLSRILTFRAPTAQVVVSMLYALRLQLRKPGGGPSPNVPAQMSLIR